MRNSDITLMFQGAFKPYINREKESFVQNVRMARQALPGAKIIASTWEGTEIPRGLLVDDIIFTKDPGGLAPLKLNEEKANNLNRQLVSTQAGLAAVTTPYAVKLRTDCYLEHAGFLDYYADLVKRDRGRERLVACSFFTLDPTIFERLSYHLSDWFQFGTTDLLRSYWSAAPMSQEDSRFYEFNAHAVDSTYFEKKFRSRFAVEQHICASYAHSRGYACPQFLNDTSERILEDYYKFLATEVLILDPWQIGLVFPKYAWVASSLFQQINNLMHLDWLEMSGQPDFSDLSPAHLAASIKRRARQKSIVRAGFRLTRPLHPYIFRPSGRAGTVRKVAYRVLKHLV